MPAFTMITTIIVLVGTIKSLIKFLPGENIQVKNLNHFITQKNFLESMGILERAKIVAKKMKFAEQTDLYLRIQRLLSPKYMGNLFKVILAYNFKDNNFAGFK